MTSAAGIKIDSALCKRDIVSFIEVSEINTGKRSLKLSRKESVVVKSYFMFVLEKSFIWYLREYKLYKNPKNSPTVRP